MGLFALGEGEGESLKDVIWTRGGWLCWSQNQYRVAKAGFRGGRC